MRIQPTAALFLLSILTTGSFGPAPQPEAPGTYQAQVRFANRTPYPRREWGLATVPFPQGAWDGNSPMTAVGVPSEVVPFGARWPDGSVRFAQLAALVDLPPGQETVVTVAPGAPYAGPFRITSWVQHALSMLDWRLAVGVPGRGTQLVGLQLHAVEQVSPVRAVYWFQGRVPETNLVYDFWVSVFDDQDHMPFELRLTSSSTASTAWSEQISFVDLATVGVVPHVRGAERRGASYGAMSYVGPNTVRLLPATQLYDGQGHEWYGDLIAAHPAIPTDNLNQRVGTIFGLFQHMMNGCALNWRESEAFGPFGTVPRIPPWITDGGRAAALLRRIRFDQYLASSGGPWDDLPLALVPHAGTTGDQLDFGVAKLGDILASGMPDGIEEARFTCSEEANRPVHHREPDGSPVTAANHPDWVCWGGRSHFNSVVCPDSLGKIRPEPYLSFNGWSSKDHQHWSSLTLASCYMLTGSYSLREELWNEADLYISSHTLPSMKPNWSTNAIDQSRAIGRTFLTLSWNYLCTGRDDLRWWLAERAKQCVIPQYVGLSVPGPVKPITYSAPDPRVIPNYEFWKPWEEALAVVGLEACFWVTFEPEARRAAKLAARNLTYYGWKLTTSECVVATGVQWKADGSALTATEYQDPSRVVWSYGTSFSLWALPAMKLALLYAQEANDAPYISRAQQIVNRITADRTPPTDNGWDRFADWEPVY
jgi:hypothetical protein